MPGGGGAYGLRGLEGILVIPVGHRRCGGLRGFDAGVVCSVTAPVVLGRPGNMYRYGRHASEWLRVETQSLPSRQVAAAASMLVVGPLLLMRLARWTIQALGECLAWERTRPSMLTGAGALMLSFAAYVPDQRGRRWFFSLPLAPMLPHQSQLLARVWLRGQKEVALGPGLAFEGDLCGRMGDRSPADVNRLGF